MLDVGPRIRPSLLARLDALARARKQDPKTVLEDALNRYLAAEEHCEDMFRAYAAHLVRRGD